MNCIKLTWSTNTPIQAGAQNLSPWCHAFWVGFRFILIFIFTFGFSLIGRRKLYLVKRVVYEEEEETMENDLVRLSLEYLERN